MENNKLFSVEYEQSGVVFFKEVAANSMEEAKQQVMSGQPTVKIRAVSVVDAQKE
ncbi:hypothetical protein [Thalassobacillus hwangdonensis]|uniref:Inhibitor I9 domain-containing protein n=1 Tax=Thalassobacillus hwangdonensis TaxID=546108 RepID=A0ABW3L1Q3_9BACI